MIKKYAKTKILQMNNHNTNIGILFVDIVLITLTLKQVSHQIQHFVFDHKKQF